MMMSCRVSVLLIAASCVLLLSAPERGVVGSVDAEQQARQQGKEEQVWDGTAHVHPTCLQPGVVSEAGTLLLGGPGMLYCLDALSPDASFDIRVMYPATHPAKIHIAVLPAASVQWPTSLSPSPSSAAAATAGGSIRSGSPGGTRRLLNCDKMSFVTNNDAQVAQVVATRLPPRSLQQDTQAGHSGAISLSAATVQATEPPPVSASATSTFLLVLASHEAARVPSASLASGDGDSVPYQVAVDQVVLGVPWRVVLPLVGFLLLLLAATFALVLPRFASPATSPLEWRSSVPAAAVPKPEARQQ